VHAAFPMNDEDDFTRLRIVLVANPNFAANAISEFATAVIRPGSVSPPGSLTAETVEFNRSTRREGPVLPRSIRPTHLTPPSASDTAHNSAAASDTH